MVYAPNAPYILMDTIFCSVELFGVARASVCDRNFVVRFVCSQNTCNVVLTWFVITVDESSASLLISIQNISTFDIRTLLPFSAIELGRIANIHRK